MTAVNEKTQSRTARWTIESPEVVLPSKTYWQEFGEEDRSLLQRFMDEGVEYVDHDLFHQASAEEILFGQAAELPPEGTYFDEPNGVDPSHRLAGEDATLTSSEEIFLFQRYNYARMRVVQVLQEHQTSLMPFDAIRELLGWAHRAMIARGQLTQANLPLVLAMAKRTRLSGLDFNELISEGNFALLRSVDKFDCSRGFKFSTYACRAILKSFSRVAMRTSRYRCRFPTEFDPALEKSDFTERRRDASDADCVEEIRSILAENRASLNDMERTVIRERFALDAEGDPPKPKTLEQVGALIGVTKERVRQIQNKALRKIRLVLEENYLAA
jgi:RNA polymerase primary sigma factor